jgi:hypothetical protein
LILLILESHFVFYNLGHSARHPMKTLTGCSTSANNLCYAPYSIMI